MKLTTFDRLYVHELKDLYSAEQQMIDALPQVIETVNDRTLRQAFEGHLKETKQQKKRLEKIFESLDFEPGGVRCEAMAGLIEETEGILNESDIDEQVRDAAIIAGAQRIEHYEISAYGTARRYAERLGRTEDVELLSASLAEESSADTKLDEIATSIVNDKAQAAE